MPVPDPYEPGEGAKYATLLAKASQRLSLVLLVAGWILVFIGGILAMTAAIVGQVNEQEKNETIIKAFRRQRGLLCSAFAIVCAGTGWQCLDRSSAASQAASIATLAIAYANADPPQDRKAYKACVRAKASWLEGRMNHDRIQSIVNNLSKAPGDKTKLNEALQD